MINEPLAKAIEELGDKPTSAVAFWAGGDTIPGLGFIRCIRNTNDAKALVEVLRDHAEAIEKEYGL